MQWTFLVILLVIFGSTLVQAVFSFGGALIALPLLAFLIEVRYATPLMTLLSATIAVVIVWRNWRDIEVKNAWRLIASALVGIPLGILFLSRFDGTIVKLVLALTVIGFAAINLISIKQVRVAHENYAFGFGFVSGIFGGAYNISGPPVVLYGSLKDWSPNRFRATIQSYALFTNLFAIGGHYVAHNITTQVLTYYLYALPIVAGSIWLGNIIHPRIPHEHYARYVKTLLLGLGISLLVAVAI